MDHFQYRSGQLCDEDVPLTEIAAQHGTPCYVYSRASIERHWHAFDAALADVDLLVCYAVKANSNLGVLSVMARLGSGFDIVSVGELERVLRAGGDPNKIVFSGVGKRADELRRALEVGIHCFNVESAAEFERLNEVAAEMGKRAPVSLRVNPDVDAKTHPYISTGLKENKFGIAYEEALVTYRAAAALPHLKIIGIDCHIGSQLLDAAPLLEALNKVIELIDQLTAEGIHLHHLDIGGGIGITYDNEKPVAVADYLAQVFARVDAWRAKKYEGKSIKVMFEPGRSIVGNAGILLTEVQYLKHGETKNFAIVDAAMNDLMRPAMYEAWHGVQPVLQRSDRLRTYDVVGPVCESGDWLARARALAIEPGDKLAILSAGAYGLSMASNYNARGRAAEVMIDGDRSYLIRKREAAVDLFALESVIQ